MKYTNTQNLITAPMWENLNRSLMDSYSSGRGKTDISATQLKNGALQNVLAKRYADAVQKDVTDIVIPAMGSILHKAFEEAAPDEWLVEHRFFKEVDGLVVSGQADIIIPTKVDIDGCMESCILGDYKTTSMYKLKKKVEDLDDFEAQLNVLAYLMADPDWVENQYGEPVEWAAPDRIDKLLIVGVAKDYSRAKAIQNNFKVPLKEIEMPAWTLKQTETFIKDRLRLYKEAVQTAETKGYEFIPECTAKEVFADPDKYAVMKEGNKKASKLFEDLKEARKYAKEKGKEYSVETRPGIRKKCVFKYCDYTKFCPYGEEAENRKQGKEAFKKLLDAKLKEESKKHD